jgi:hypothetical protein
MINLIAICNTHISYLIIVSVQVSVNLHTYTACKLGSSVSIVSEYGADDRGSIPDRGRWFYLRVDWP